jgi:L-ascorbate metabolism protein UlaG (beta-lactamase superfamily)
MKKSNVVRKLALAAAAAGVAAAVERLVLASPRYRGPRSDHFDGERFHNQDPGWQSEGSFLKWMATRKRGAWREWVDAPYGSRPEATVGDGRVRVTFVNHATMLIQMDGVNILTDPIWSDYTSPIDGVGPKRHRPPGIRFRELPKIDHVLLSHNHYDHLDLPTLHRLRVRHAPHMITMLGNAALLRRNALAGASELDWWQSLPIGNGITITAVPSKHFSARALSDRNATLWGGFVISGPSGNVYFAGDTGWGSHFAQIAERFSPIRLAILPIGAYQPRWFMKPAHISPDEAVEAHQVLGASTSVAMHFGTFQLADDAELQPVEDLRTALDANGNPRFWILDFGEGRDVPPAGE